MQIHVHKLPLQLLLTVVIKDSGHSNYRISNPTMEEIGATNPKYQSLRV